MPLALLLAGCGDASVTGGTHVAISVAPSPCEGCTFSEAHAVVESVELVACESHAATLLRLLRPIDIAYGHGTGSPTVLEVPVAIDLLGGTEIAEGALEPPAGSYCAVRVHFGPADDDAVGLPSEELIGSSFRVIRDDGGVGASSRTSSKTLALDPALELDEGALDAALHIRLGTGWSEPLGTAVDDAAFARAFDALAAGMTVTVSR